MILWGEIVLVWFLNQTNACKGHCVHRDPPVRENPHEVQLGVQRRSW